MEEAAENSKQFLHSAHANGMNEFFCNSQGTHMSNYFPTTFCCLFLDIFSNTSNWIISSWTHELYSRFILQIYAPIYTLTCKWCWQQPYFHR